MLFFGASFACKALMGLKGENANTTANSATAATNPATTARYRATGTVSLRDAGCDTGETGIVDSGESAASGTNGSTGSSVAAACRAWLGTRTVEAACRAWPPTRACSAAGRRWHGPPAVTASGSRTSAAVGCASDLSAPAAASAACACRGARAYIVSFSLATIPVLPCRPGIPGGASYRRASAFGERFPITTSCGTSFVYIPHFVNQNTRLNH